MKSFIKFTKTKFFVRATVSVVAVCLISTISIQANSARAEQRGLSNSDALMFSQNDITNWDPGECVERDLGSTGICGNSAKEIYISVLSQEYDMVHVAAIFGSISHEGGFNPVMWQGNAVGDGGVWQNGRNFDYYYNNCGDSCGVGVGAFQITWGLSKYLQKINSDAPDLLEYFKNPAEYSYGYYYKPSGDYDTYGDAVLAKVGKATFRKLVEFEVAYLWNDKEAFKSESDLYLAADWWTENFENCENCCGAADKDKSCEQIGLRRKSAKKAYAEYKDFKCSDDGDVPSSASSGSSNSGSASSSGSSSSSSTGSDVTIIGDSITATAKSAILAKLPDADIHAKPCKTVGMDVTITCGGANPPNESGLNIAKQLEEDNKLRDNIFFLLGTNASGFDKLEDALKVIGSERKIYLMSLYESSNNHADQNTTIEKIVKDNENVSLVDWSAAVKDKASTLLIDGTHPNAEGSKIFADLIANALGDPDDCTTYEGKYPEYLQASEPWGGLDYGGCTFATCACGPTSMAMLATVAAGQDIFPTDVADLTKGTQYYWATTGSGMAALDKIVGDHYKFEVETVSYDSLSDAETKMRDYLKQGYMIHLSGAGSPPFSTGGHYIGIFSIDSDDNVSTANSSKGLGGNAEMPLHSLVQAGMHGSAFSIIKGSGNKKSCSTNICDDGNKTNSSSSGSDVVKSVEEIIALANKNGSTYTWGGGHTSDSSVFDNMLNGSPINVDCTGFASLVMYKTYGKMTSFTSSSIFSDPLYEEVSRADVRPGDVFVYESPSGHGGIVIEASGGVVTKIAEAGGSEGRSGSNNNIGYSNTGDFSITNINGRNGHFFRWKGN